MTTVRVDIFSDVICPWCLIGYRRLKAAADGLDDIDIDLHWLPFELNPEMPAAGMDRQTYLERKFGPERAGEIYGHIAKVLQDDGIDADVTRIKRTPSTLKAHRLILLAESHGLGTALKTRLFDCYFKDGLDIGDDVVLLDAAEAAGLDPAEVGNWLRSHEGTDDVRQLEAEAQRIGVTGVPFIILDRRLAVSGAQPVELMQDALRQAASAAKPV